MKGRLPRGVAQEPAQYTRIDRARRTWSLRRVGDVASLPGAQSCNFGAIVPRSIEQANLVRQRPIPLAGTRGRAKALSRPVQLSIRTMRCNRSRTLMVLSGDRVMTPRLPPRSGTITAV